VWGIEQYGGISANRILQKRGKVIKNDDFSVLRESYPEHPLSNAPRRHYNKEEMLLKRKQ
jgi:hypothetical protein